jgi:hypothetical protein
LSGKKKLPSPLAERLAEAEKWARHFDENENHHTVWHDLRDALRKQADDYLKQEKQNDGTQDI